MYNQSVLVDVILTSFSSREPYWQIQWVIVWFKPTANNPLNISRTNHD